MNTLTFTIVRRSRARARRRRSLPQQGNEDLPRRQYESGLSFLQGQRYAEALKDFQAVIDSFPRSQVADNALLQIALYQLDVAHDLGVDAVGGRSAAEGLSRYRLRADGATSSAGAWRCRRAAAPAEVDAAVASFERVERLFPGNDAVPAAGFYAGEALRLVRRHDEALERYRRVTASYPSSPWAARANLAAGYCLVQSDAPPRRCRKCSASARCMPQSLDGGRRRSTSTRSCIDSTCARRASRRSRSAAGSSATRRAEFRRRDRRDASIALNRLLLGHKQRHRGVRRRKGTLTRTVTRATSHRRSSSTKPDRIVFAREGGAAHRDAWRRWRSRCRSRRPSRRGRVEEIPRSSALSTGHRIVVDKKEKTVDSLRRRRPLPRPVRAGDQHRAAGDQRAGRCGDDRQGRQGDHHRRSRRQAAVEDPGQGRELPVRRAGRPGVRSARASLRARSRQGVGATCSVRRTG